MANFLPLQPAKRASYDLAQTMLQQASQKQPTSWMEALGGLAQVASGAHRSSQYEQEAGENSRRMAELFTSGDLSNPELMSALSEYYGPEAALGLAQGNRSYGLQERQLSLAEAEAERERQMQESLMGVSGMQGNPFYVASVMGNDPGAAYDIYANTPAGGSGTMIPPDAPPNESATAQAVYNQAVTFYGEDTINQWSAIAGGMPGQEVDTMDWLRAGQEFLRDNGVDTTALGVLQDMANGQRQATAGPINTGANQPVPPADVLRDRITGEPLIGPNGGWRTPQGEVPIPGPAYADTDMVNAVNGLARDFGNEEAVKDFGDVQTGYANMTKALESGAGDIAIIFSFMKMLDPGSTVREGEAATAQNAPGVSGYVRQLYNETVEGRALTPQRRADIIAEAQSLYANSREAYDGTADSYRRRAEAFGVDPALVIPDNLIQIDQTSIQTLIDDLYSRNPDLPMPGGR